MGEKEVTEVKRLWLIELVKLVKEQLLQCMVDFFTIPLFLYNHRIPSSVSVIKRSKVNQKRTSSLRSCDNSSAI